MPYLFNALFFLFISLFVSFNYTFSILFCKLIQYEMKKDLHTQYINSYKVFIIFYYYMLRFL